MEHREVQLKFDNDVLSGDLCIPEAALAMVLFAHGSGSSRHSQRNKFVASELNKEGFATLLVDLLTPNEEVIDTQNRELRFNIPLLSTRVLLAIGWLDEMNETRDLPIGIFGASTGSAAAIIAAVEARPQVVAVVSRGGRPDLAERYFSLLESPTLLIVGSDDEQVVKLNEKAIAKMHCPRKLEIVQGATHLFEEPGKLEEVALLTKSWFLQYMAPPNRQQNWQYASAS
jgi:pimeloyl-ACP methyl ester carboxylesterase